MLNVGSADEVDVARMALPVGRVDEGVPPPEDASGTEDVDVESTRETDVPRVTAGVPPEDASGTEDVDVEPTRETDAPGVTSGVPPGYGSGTEDDGGVVPTRKSDAPVDEGVAGLSPIVFIFSDKNECRLRLIAQPIKKCQYQVCYSAGS